MIIMKFGGSSVGTGKRMLHVAEIIKNASKHDEILVVVSAIYKVTDKLISIFDKYKSGALGEAFEEMRVLYKIHKQVLNDLSLKEEYQSRIDKALLDLFGNLSWYLTLNSEYSKEHYDYVISFGERLSSCLLAASLNKNNVEAKAVDASRVIIATNEFSNAKALIKDTREHAKGSLMPLLSRKIVPVVTGFFGKTKDGKIITLGRGGSDYSATILPNVLDAKEVILWKEVDGVFSADPKKDEHAKFYPELSYEEALALAQKGAKVLHPEAMKPVSSKGIIVRVKNTFNPEFKGTKIWKGVSL